MTAAMAFVFTALNSYLTIKFALFYPDYTPSTFGKTFRMFIGVALFLCGFAGNYWADQILLDLRKNNQKNDDSGAKKYFIPKGWIYTLISCPNYACEILEWLGLWIAFPTIAMLNFVVCTSLNLVPRAISNHKWYKDKFKDEYPKERKAVIPYIL
jgi:steroid 5-alpha-reductase